MKRQSEEITPPDPGEVTSEGPVVDANHVQRFDARASAGSYHTENGIIADW